MIPLLVALLLAQQAVTGTATVKIRPKIVITSPLALPEAYEGTPYSYQFTATGGKPPYVWTATQCVKLYPDGTTGNCASATAGLNVPSGLTLGPDGKLYGTPNESGEFSISVSVSDTK